MYWKNTARIALIAAPGLLAGCSNTGLFGKVGGEDRAALPALEVPPPLSAPDPEAATYVPEVASARAMERQAAEQPDGLITGTESVEIARAGNRRYLEVEAPPQEVWREIQAFLADEGYVVARKDRALGIIETQWSGTGAGAPEREGLQGLLMRAVQSFSAPDVQDKLRLRLEPGEGGGSRVFLSHRRMERVGEENAMGEAETFTWEPAEPDPALENEVLVRLMVHLGMAQEDARARVARAELAPRAEMIYDSEKGETRVVVEQNRTLAWNRLVRALETTGFDIVAADREDGELRVRHPRPDVLAQGGRMTSEQLDAEAPEDVEPLELKLVVKERDAGGIEILPMELGSDPDVTETERLVGSILSERLR